MAEIFIPFIDGEYTISDAVTAENKLPGVRYFNLTSYGFILNAEDIFILAENCNKRYYSTKSTLTKNTIDLPILKVDKILELKKNYENSYQIATLKGNINFALRLSGGDFDELNSVTGKGLKDTKRVYVKVLRINQDNSFTPFKSKVPAIVANEIFKFANNLSVHNFDTNTHYKEKIKNAQTIEELNSLDILSTDYTTGGVADEFSFYYNIEIDLDDLIDEISLKSDTELLEMKYFAVDVADFRAWKLALNKDANDKYIVFYEF